MHQAVQLTYYRKLEFSRFGGIPLTMDLFVPETVNGQAPVIVWIYGGAWRERNHLFNPIVWMTERGYAVASIDYRMSWEAKFPAQSQDCKAAIRWLRANAERLKLDPERIGVWGESSGGHLAALLGTAGQVAEFDAGDNLAYPSHVQAVCDYYGPTDFLQMDVAGSDFSHDAAESPESQLIGGPIQQNKELTVKTNPIFYIAGNDSLPPFLIVHGDNDRIVPHHQSELLYEALKQSGADVRFHSVKGAGHRHFTGADVVKMVNDFFDRHLK